MWLALALTLAFHTGERVTTKGIYCSSLLAMDSYILAQAATEKTPDAAIYKDGTDVSVCLRLPPTKSIHLREVKQKVYNGILYIVHERYLEDNGQVIYTYTEVDLEDV